MFKIGNVTITRNSPTYNQLKHLISLMVIGNDSDYLPSIRKLSEMLGTHHNNISHAILHLAEDDKWLKKVGDGTPRGSKYKIIATIHQVKAYQKYYCLSPSKKSKFRKIVRDVVQNEQIGAKTMWAFGTPDWDKYFSTKISFWTSEEGRNIDTLETENEVYDVSKLREVRLIKIS